MPSANPLRAASRGARRFSRLVLVALPLMLAVAVVGQRLSTDAGVAGGLGQLSLTSSSGTSLVETLTAFSLSATRPRPTSLGGLSLAPAAYSATATLGANSASTDDSLIQMFDATTWKRATVTLNNLHVRPTYVLTDLELHAYLLESDPGKQYVELTITARSLSAPPSVAPTTTSTSTSTTPPPAVQTCVTNPEHLLAGEPHSSFPLASFEVPTTGRIRQSSPTLATISKHETIAVFGDEDGNVYVVNAATCQLLPGWPRQMVVPPGQLLPGLAPDNRHAVIESTPAVGWLNGPKQPPSIIVGAGSTWDNTGVGELEAFNLHGQQLWDFPVHGAAKNANGVFSSPAIGPVVPGTGTDVVFGSWDFHLYVLDAAGKLVASYDNGETIWSSPALYKLSSESTDDIFVGLDKTESDVANGCVGGVFADLRWAPVSSAVPGSLRPLRRAGVEPAMGLEVVHESACQGAPPGGHKGQAVWSSPAIGLLGGHLVAAIGTSFYDMPYGPGTDRVYVYPLGGTEPPIIRPLWTAPTPGPVFGSPAIGEVAVPGAATSQAAVVDTSFVCPRGPQSLASCESTNVSAVQAFVLKGSMLSLLWRDDLPGGASLTSPILVPLRGEAANDVLVGSSGGLYPLSGGSGLFLDGTATSPPQMSIHSACRLFNSPAVAEVAGPGPYAGWYAFELCSDGTETTGGLYAFHLEPAPGATPAWPMFRGDPSHSGASWSTLGQPSPRGDPIG
jgi:hypothetical protein